MKDPSGARPVVRAMSEIAGSTVMLIAAEYLARSNEGKGIILGGITGVPPSQVVILGAGTVAEYAARAATGLGAEVKVFDNHLYKLRRLKHNLGMQLYTSTLDTFALSQQIRRADVVIGALARGRRPHSLHGARGNGGQHGARLHRHRREHRPGRLLRNQRDDQPQQARSSASTTWCTTACPTSPRACPAPPPMP